MVLERLRTDQEFDNARCTRMTVRAHGEPADDDLAYVRGGERFGREAERLEHLAETTSSSNERSGSVMILPRGREMAI